MPVLILPCANRRTLEIRQTLIATLVIEERLIPKDAKAATDALENAWQSARREIRTGTLNLITWLDDALREASAAGLWVPPILLRRLRQLQRGELKACDAKGIEFEIPQFYGLPEDFIAVAVFMGWKRPAIVRKLKAGFEQLDGRDATAFLNSMVECWQSRPTDESDKAIRLHIESTVKRYGLELR